MNKFLITSVIMLGSFFLAGFHLPPVRSQMTHYNITFAPDLSNRVNSAKYARPLQDVLILERLMDNIYPSILRQGRLEQQQDKFRVDLINKGLISKYHVQTQRLSLDFSRFGTKQIDRINYIRGNHSSDTLKHDIVRLNGEFSRIYNLAKTQNFGADIWTYLNEFKEVQRPEKAVKDDIGNLYENKYRNVLVLTTDGYIEAGIFGKGYDLSQKRVNDFRKAFLSSGDNDLGAFFNKHKDFRIKPVQNQNLKNVEILVMELFDRSRSKDGAATVHPTDLDILKLFWADWLKQSGVKRFELHACASSKAEAERTLLTFLGVSKKANPIQQN